jgi:hypothetical protein
MWSEGVMYSRGALKCRDSLDISFCTQVELGYETIVTEESYSLVFSRYCVSCNNSAFLVNCSGCANCLGCINLRNKSYHIFNKPYSKEEYEKKLKEFNLGSYEGLQRFKSEFEEFIKVYPNRYAHILNSPDSTGDNLFDCRNCRWSFDVSTNTENCKYIAHAGFDLKDTYHSYGLGLGELMYEVVNTGVGTSKIICSVFIRNGHDVSYSYSCHGSSNIFGCVGIRNKQYCILNKQYSKEEYESMIPQIIEHMDKMPYMDSMRRIYKYGEFFPVELAPFAYNEPLSQEYYPLTKEEAIKRGYSWKDSEKRPYAIITTIGKVPDHIKDVKDSILEETIGCAHQRKCNEQCTTAFKIVPKELDFYRKLNLPLPRLCHNCRHYQRIKQRNPLYLWRRQCTCAGVKSENSVYANQTAHFHGFSHCPNEFETSYSPERPEIVYCEACYQSEVQ